jgi:hypothetical protein
MHRPDLVPGTGYFHMTGNGSDMSAVQAAVVSSRNLILQAVPDPDPA